MNPIFRVFLLLITTSISSIGVINAQNGCIEVESILVDACDNNSTSPEGLNEMFRFRTSDFQLNISEITIFNGWPSEGTNFLPFNGFVQNNSTIAKTAQLNATITSCGLLVEPPNGDIPPNSSVLAITSYEVSATLNSFANLSDTIFVIYHQHSGDAGGHFLNQTNGSPQAQELRIQITGANACIETVTYQRGQLVNTSGGNTAQNGATVTFTVDGIPSYSNSGCTAPVTIFSANWTNPTPVCSTNPVINLNSLVTGTPGGTWSGQGVVGNTFNPALVTGSSDVTYTVLPTNSCILNSAVQTNTIQVLQSVDASVNNPGNVCGSIGTLNLNPLITGTQGGIWTGNGVSGSVLNVSGINGPTTVTYSVGSGICTDAETITINVIQLSPLQITGETLYCNGENPSALSAIPDAQASVSWYLQSDLQNPIGQGSSFLPTAGLTQTYISIQTLSGCESQPSQIEVEFSFVDRPTGDTLLKYCNGDAIPLANAMANGELNWYTDSQLSNLVATGFNYQSPSGNVQLYVTSTSGNCISSALEIEIVEIPLLEAMITNIGGTSLCPGIPIELESNALSFNSWSTGSTDRTITVSEPGIYTLTRVGECNTAVDEITITGLPVTTQFVVSQDSGYIVLPVMVLNESINSESCTWFINDLEYAFSAPGTINFSEPGEYELKLVCSNSTGCYDEMSTTIKVLSDKLLLQIPNVFTPNGDGTNELFQVGHNAVKTFQARVFNRWGKLLYSWEDVTSGWNGKFNNEAMPDGTYFYIINGTDIKDYAFEKKGVVTLLGQ
jgi:gliding motility-associated-like protein